MNVGKRVQRGPVAWIQLCRALQVPHRLGKMAVPSLDKTHQSKNPDIVRQGLSCDFQLGQRAIVIPIPSVKVFGLGQVRFAGVWTDPQSVLDRCFRHR